MRRGAMIIAGGCLALAALGSGARAEGVALAQYYGPGYPPPRYGSPPPCAAVTPSPLRGAAGGAARGALVGAIFGNAGRGAAIGTGIGGIGAASRRGAARAYGACY